MNANFNLSKVPESNVQTEWTRGRAQESCGIKIQELKSRDSWASREQENLKSTTSNKVMKTSQKDFSC